MLAISTAWNYDPQKKMKEQFKEIKSLGFKAIELGYKVTKEQMDEIYPLLKEMEFEVSSIHNFCPVPYDAPSPRHPSNYYRLSAIDETERQRAVEWTKKSVDTAIKVSSRVVVINAGTVELNQDPTEILKKFKTGQTDEKEFMQLRDKMLIDRQKSRKPFLDALKKSLNEVVLYAHQRKIQIGLETRYYPTEMPNFEEIGEILKMFHPHDMGYWHDVGHAEVNVRLGVVKLHADYFKAYATRLIGWHIHGVEGIKDHLAPFTGDFDLNTVLPFMKDRHIKVIESHSATSAQIKEAFTKLS